MSTILPFESGHPPQPVYHVPALEKGLDVLECLAAAGSGCTQAELARTLGRAPGELFRILTTLERRGFILREPLSGAYSLTLRLYELAHAHSPFSTLLRAADEPMRRLAGATGESCHLSVISAGRLLVLHQAEAPARVRISVETGSTIALHQSASGRVMLAHAGVERQDALLAGLRTGGTLSQIEEQTLREQFWHILARGYEGARDETVEGVSDLAVPVGAGPFEVTAALAISALPRNHRAFVQQTLPALQQCAAEIARLAGLTVEINEGGNR